MLSVRYSPTASSGGIDGVPFPNTEVGPKRVRNACPFDGLLPRTCEGSLIPAFPLYSIGDAAAQQRKAKEQAAEGEQTIAQRRRSKASTPENDPGDRPPPDGDDQPWQIYLYRPHIEVRATLEYEAEERGVRHYDLESAYRDRLISTENGVGLCRFPLCVFGQLVNWWPPHSLEACESTLNSRTRSFEGQNWPLEIRCLRCSASLLSEILILGLI